MCERKAFPINHMVLWGKYLWYFRYGMRVVSMKFNGRDNGGGM